MKKKFSTKNLTFKSKLTWLVIAVALFFGGSFVAAMLNGAGPLSFLTHKSNINLLTEGGGAPSASAPKPSASAPKPSASAPKPSASVSTTTGASCSGGIPSGSWGASGYNMCGKTGPGSDPNNCANERECRFCKDGTYTDSKSCSSQYQSNPSKVVLPPSAGTEYTQGTKTANCDPANQQCQKDNHVTCTSDSCGDASFQDTCINSAGNHVPSGTTQGSDRCTDGSWVPDKSKTCTSAQTFDAPTNSCKNKCGNGYTYVNGYCNLNTMSEAARENMQDDQKAACEAQGLPYDTNTGLCQAQTAGRPQSCVEKTTVISSTSTGYNYCVRDSTGKVTSSGYITCNTTTSSYDPVKHTCTPRNTDTTKTTYPNERECELNGTYTCTKTDSGRWTRVGAPSGADPKDPPGGTLHKQDGGQSVQDPSDCPAGAGGYSVGYGTSYTCYNSDGTQYDYFAAKAEDKEAAEQAAMLAPGQECNRQENLKGNCLDVCPNGQYSFVGNKTYCGTSAQVQSIVKPPAGTYISEQGDNRSNGSICTWDSDCLSGSCSGFIFGTRTCTPKTTTSTTTVAPVAPAAHTDGYLSCEDGKNISRYTTAYGGYYTYYKSCGSAGCTKGSQECNQTVAAKPATPAQPAAQAGTTSTGLPNVGAKKCEGDFPQIYNGTSWAPNGNRCPNGCVNGVCNPAPANPPAQFTVPGPSCDWRLFGFIPTPARSQSRCSTGTCTWVTASSSNRKAGNYCI